MANECRKQSVCSVAGCGKKHTKFVHLDHDAGRRVGSTGTDGAEVSNASANASAFGSLVSLPIVPVIVNGTHQAYGLLDSGSTNSFVSESLVNKMELAGSEVSYRMNTLSQSIQVNSRTVSLNLSPLSGECQSTLDRALVIPSIPATYSCRSGDLRDFPHLADLPIQTFDHDVHADILIGMDNPHLLMPLEIRCNDQNRLDPYATRTYFGWSGNGPLASTRSSEVYSNFVDVERHIENL